MSKENFVPNRIEQKKIADSNENNHWEEEHWRLVGFLIKHNWFGLFKPNPQLEERVGDYVLVMKENYIIKDSVLSDNSKIFLGNHGGLSREEMVVPLITVGQAR